MGDAKRSFARQTRISSGDDDTVEAKFDEDGHEKMWYEWIGGERREPGTPDTRNEPISSPRQTSNETKPAYNNGGIDSRTLAADEEMFGWTSEALNQREE